MLSNPWNNLAGDFPFIGTLHVLDWHLLTSESRSIGILYWLHLGGLLPELTYVHQKQVLIRLVYLQMSFQSFTPNCPFVRGNNSLIPFKKELESKNGVLPGTIAILNLACPSGSTSARRLVSVW